MSSKARNKQHENLIREVYADNFSEEIKLLSKSLEIYNYVGMDTEFPGVVYQSNSATREAYYRTIKTNVDNLQVIQIGITLTDRNGNYPSCGGTWQFNIKFDLSKETYAADSIALLSNSGINFDTLATRGISPDTFGEYIITSGLILNEKINWVSFHGIYDFAYLLKISSNLPLPDNESLFFESINLYFPNYYDIRVLVRYNDEFRGSLSRVGQEMKISRIGTQHQAGSDSLITIKIFLKLMNEYLSEDNLKSDKNILYGIGVGLEDSDTYLNQNNFNSYNNANSGGKNYSYDYNVYQQNLMNMQYNMMRNNSNFYNGVYTYNNYNPIGMQLPYTMGHYNNDDIKKNYNPNKSIVED